MKKRSAQMAAFTIVEALIVTLIIVLLAAIILPTSNHMISTTNGCINNLRQIDAAFQVFALEHSDRFPWQCPVTNSGTLELVGSESPVPHFQAVSIYLKSF